MGLLRRIFPIVIAALSLMLLAACGGGGGGVGTAPVSSYTVGGTITGLSAAGLMLQNNGGDDLTVNGDGNFTFATPLASGADYNITVLSQPAGLLCTVANGAGTIAIADVSDVAVTCTSLPPPPPNTYLISGSVTGLTSAGLVLQNNGGDGVTINGNGDFIFPTALLDGSNYDVTILIQPAGLKCTVANGAGALAGANVTNIVVTCVAAYTLGGSVTGMSATGLILQNNGGDDLTVNGDGVFTFATPLASGEVYNITLLAQPTGLICIVANGAGTVAAANVGDVAVSCAAPPPPPPNTHAVGGSVTGLATTGLVLQNNGGDGLTLNGDGGFTFATSLPDGSAYDVTVLTQPAGQKCAVANGSGIMTGGNVTNIVVTCVDAYTVGGSVTGLNATGLVLQNNGGDGLNVNANGAFAFATSLTDGSPYNVTILAHPTGQSCAISNNTGTIAGANVGSIVLTCVLVPPDAPTLLLSYGIKQLRFSWSELGNTTYYQLFEDPDGVSGYSQIGGNLTATFYDHEIALPRRINARYLLRACNGTGCTSSSSLSVSATLAQAVGYIKASNTEANDYFGYTLALSGDGNTLVVGTPYESSSATGIDGNQGDNSAAGSGAAYVYARSGSLWTQQAYLKASNTGVGDQFGWAVALSSDGNTLAVGALYEDSNATGVNGNQSDNSATAAGAVYLFTRSGGAWSQQAYVKASNTGIGGDQFGWSVALSGDGATLAVGVPYEDSNAVGVGGNQNDNSAVSAGAVYVFSQSGGAWTQQAYVKASNTGASDFFGYTVALSSDGNTLAAGAINEASNATGVGGSQTNNSLFGAGAAYAFTRSGGVWTQQAYVKASNPESNDFFGYVIALSGDGGTLAVGATGEDSSATGIDGNQAANTALDSGAAYLFSRSGSAWSQQAYIKASNSEATDQFGIALALSSDGNTLAVGAYYEDSNATGVGGNQSDNSAADAGAAYLYSRSGGVWSQHAYLKASNAGTGDSFGRTLTMSSDGNTLAVGATGEDSGATGIGGNQSDYSAVNAGAVYLY